MFSKEVIKQLFKNEIYLNVTKLVRLTKPKKTQTEISRLYETDNIFTKCFISPQQKGEKRYITHLSGFLSSRKLINKMIITA